MSSSVRMIKSIGMRHLRIKMGSDFEQNKTALETVWEVFGSDCEQRIDPNGVWDFDLAMSHLPLIGKVSGQDHRRAHGTNKPRIR